MYYIIHMSIYGQNGHKMARVFIHYADSVSLRCDAGQTVQAAAGAILAALGRLSSSERALPERVELRRSRDADALEASSLLCDCCPDGGDVYAFAVSSVPMVEDATVPLKAPQPKADPASLLASAKELEGQRRLAAANALYTEVLSAVSSDKEANAKFAPACFLGLAANAMAAARSFGWAAGL
jgi:hypothetical protein